MTRYKGAFLGLFWTLVQPLMMLAVYTFVFTVLFQPRTASADASRAEFVVRLFCGIIVFGIFSETTARAPLLVVSKPSYVRKVIFPLEILPLASLGTSLVFLIAGLAILLAAIAIVYHTFSITIVLFPVVLVPLLLLSLGLGWFLASLGVFIRDTSHGVRILLQALFFLTPIVWTVDLLPERWQPLVNINPLATVIEGAKATLIYGTWPNWGWLAGATLVSLVVMLAGYFWFMKTKRGFADVL